MAEFSAITPKESFGSKALDKIVYRLKSTDDPRKRYEYVLWLAKGLPQMPEELKNDLVKVKGCISQVHVAGELINGKLQWTGDSDALITKGLLAILIKGLSNLTPEEVLAINPQFIEASGLNGSLTPSRANGFLNILLAMQAQAKALTINPEKFASSS